MATDSRERVNDDGTTANAFRGGINPYRALNCGAVRQQLLFSDAGFINFEAPIEETHQQISLPIYTYELKAIPLCLLFGRIGNFCQTCQTTRRVEDFVATDSRERVKDDGTTANAFRAGINLYRALNWGAVRQQLLFSDDFINFEALIEETHQQISLPIYTYELMPNHWHFAVGPRG